MPWSSRSPVPGLTLLWAPSMVPYLLYRGLKHGPLFCRWFTMVLQWVCNDSELGAHTREQQDLRLAQNRPQLGILLIQGPGAVADFLHGLPCLRLPLAGLLSRSLRSITIIKQPWYFVYIPIMVASTGSFQIREPHTDRNFRAHVHRRPTRGSQNLWKQTVKFLNRNPACLDRAFKTKLGTRSGTRASHEGNCSNKTRKEL